MLANPQPTPGAQVTPLKLDLTDLSAIDAALDKLLAGSPIGRTRDAAPGTPADRPVQRLLALHVEASRQLHAATSTFLGEDRLGRTPYVIGIAGSVAVGKSTTAAAILIWRFVTYYFYLIVGAPVFLQLAGRPLLRRLMPSRHA